MLGPCGNICETCDSRFMCSTYKEANKDIGIFRKGNVYKIAWKNRRRDAKRHLLKSFQAENEKEAIKRFKEVVPQLPDKYTYALFTGNWKYIISVDDIEEELIKGD